MVSVGLADVVNFNGRISHTSRDGTHGHLSVTLRSMLTFHFLIALQAGFLLGGTGSRTTFYPL